jgi:uncharacterized repeat protein (TIGR02543 family)
MPMAGGLPRLRRRKNNERAALSSPTDGLRVSLFGFTHGMEIALWLLLKISSKLSASRLRGLSAFGVALFVIGAAAPLRAQLVPQEQAIFNYMSTDPQQGRAFLKYDPILEKVARAHAADMAARNYFAHVNPDGHGPNWMVVNAGYQLPAWWGTPTTENYIESIGAGYTNPQDMWTAWMNSPEHKTHILGLTSFFASETSYGIGYVYAPGSTYGYYWVIITAPPQPLEIDAPLQGSKVTTSSITASGASDADGGTAPASIVWRLENAVLTGTNAMDFQTADGVENWTAQVDNLLPGSNTLRVQSLDDSGNLIDERTSTFTYVEMSTLNLVVSGSGHVTAGFTGTTSLQVGVSYSVTAIPATGYVFTGWTGDITAASAALKFTMPQPGLNLTANFIVNPFIAAKGFYNGLLSVGGTAAGFVSVTAGVTGSFTGKFVFNGVAHSISGKFDLQGNFQTTVAKDIFVQLHIDLTNGTDEITGTISEGGMTTDVSADQLVYSATNPAPSLGRYTIALPPDSGNADAPQANSIAFLNVTKTGMAQIAGTLADGTAFSQSVGIAQDGTFSIFVPLYAKLGSVGGTFTFDPVTGELNGAVVWDKPSKPATKSAAAFPGFSEQIAAVGSIYMPVSGTPVLNFVNGMLTFDDGGTVSVSQAMTLAGASSAPAVLPNLANVSMKIYPANGMFTGSFKSNGVHYSYRGAVLQKQISGSGFFLETAGSGNVNFGPAQ